MRHPRGTMTVRVGAFELSRRGIARFDWRDPYYVAVNLPWSGFAGAVLLAEAVINLAFGLVYFANPGCIANMRPGSFSDAFFFSVETLATVGYGSMSPHTLYGHAVSALEMVCGMAFTSIMTGLFFVRFSRPRARILFAQDAVVSSYNGRRTLMFRIGNGRVGLLTHASASVSVLMAEQSQEGQSFRRVHDLRLERHKLPLFALTWTLMHDLEDETSPLHGIDDDVLKKRDARFFVSVQAQDSKFGAFVQDMKDYGHANIRVGMRFADAVTLDEDGNALADLSRISLLEPAV